METPLKPERFDVDPACVGAESKWKHWKRTFSNFLTQVKEATEERKLQLFIYITERSEIFARHCLASRFQQTGESVNEYLQILKQLSKDCEFESVTAEEYKNEYINDAFIQEKVYDQAPVTAVEQCENTNDDSEQLSVVAPIQSRKCFFCGRDLHLRSFCPARDAICRGCGKKGHYQKVCKSKLVSSTTNSTAAVYTLASASMLHCLERSITKILVNGVQLNALIDTGSSLSFINQCFVNRCRIQVKPYFGRITMANPSISSDVTGCSLVNIKLQTHVYINVEVLIMKNLCADFLIGHDLLKDHSSVELEFKGDRPPLKNLFISNCSCSPCVIVL
ncbi:uncharacterized protein LOC118187918 [Stegodyphus dumicola]|uniref:uncharacterized protein LOC118187918 n=1 Tax=Stegodyphus dumicola TaxID=202533 RepID=UPI0015B18EA1|nr:uncharacterized protein LOC118187918 [Stegodyphus dumicola]